MTQEANHLSSSAFSKKRRCVENEASPTRQLNRSFVKRPRESLPQVVGKVVGIELENFMCHNKLKLEFDVATNNCFYIIGPNGSGKSALFAGLNIGLGGTGRSNERGKSIQSYIKEGEKYARIRVFLTNQGPNACPNYDDVIIVERNICEKTALFTLKTCGIGGRERIVSKKKADLDALLEQLNIELDNPLAWLSQDRSRQFLQQMKPEKLYQLYIKTSEMDSTDVVFQRIEAHFDEFCRILNSLDKEKKAREDNYLQMRARQQAATEVKEKKRERQKLLWYSLWAPIRDKEKKMDDLRERMEEALSQKGNSSQEVDILTNDRLKLAEKQQKLVQKKELELSKCKAHNDEIMKMKRQDRELQFEINDLETHIKRKESSKKGLDKELLKANSELERIIGNANRDIDEEKCSLERRHAENMQKIQSIEQEKSLKNADYQQINNEYQERRKLFQNHRAELSQLENKKKNLIDEQSLFQQSKTNRLALFGQDTPHLIELIKSNQHLFRKLPIGPIGNHIKLKDPKWANAVEFALRRLMNTFICDSHEDRRAIDELCRTNNITRSPEIITVKFTDQKYDISSKEPPFEFVTIERVLSDEIEPTVYNVLLDMLFIETTLLIENDDDARHIMQSSPPQNAHMAITMSCSQVYPTRGRQPYRFFSNNSQFQSRILTHRFLEQDAAALATQISQIDRQMTDKEIENHKLDVASQSIGRRLTESSSSLNEYDKQLNRLKEEQFTIRDGLQKLEKIMMSGEMIANNQESVREIRGQRENTIQQLDKLRTEYCEKIALKNDIAKTMELANKKSAYLLNDVKQTEADMSSCAMQIQKIADKCENLEENVAKIEKDVGTFRINLENYQEENEKRQADISKAQAPEGEQNPPDFEKIPSTAELERKLKAIERKIKTEENNQDPVPTNEELKQKAEEYKKFKQDHGVWARRKDKFVEMKNCRRRRYILLKASLPQKIREVFKGFMNMRGYRANLNVRDDKGIIEIRVETHQRAGDEDDNDDDEEEGGGRGRRASGKGNNSGKMQRSRRVLQDLRGLSGGERSFTTVSFVMALWSCMESPFRCSDEFDVFMDPVNRRIAMEMLNESAKTSTHIQFFFFTPQGVVELKNDESQIQVFEMKRIVGLFDGHEREEERENDEPAEN